MKRVILTLTAIIFTSLPLSAQQKFKHELYVGGSFGMTFSYVSFMPRVQHGFLRGYSFGGTILWNTEKNLGLLAEINFSQQGWKESFTDDPQYYYERRTNYVEIPFLTHIYFGGKHVKAFINLGPKIGFFLNESTSENLNGAKPNSTNIQHYLYVEKYIDWGLCGGPGIEFRTPIGNFQLEGRYYYALGNIYNSRKQDPFSKSAYQIMSAKITYLFRIK